MKKIAWMSLGILMVAVPSAATMYRLVSDERLVERAEIVVHGQIVDAVVTTRNGQLYTDYTLVPEAFHKGFEPGNEMVVSVLGGTTPDGRFLKVFGAPTFEMGQTALLFLRQRPSGTFTILHFLQGRFDQVEIDGTRMWHRDLSGEPVFPSKAGPGFESSAVARHAERFEAWVRDHAQGEPRARDYVLKVQEAQVPSKFTLLGDEPFLRWFRFDQGQAVRWFRHSTPQPGAAALGEQQFANSLAAWNDEPNTPVRYRDAGTTGSATGFGPLDGRNTILFSDLNDDIDTDYDCFDGGTLAIGGINGVVSFDPLIWRGQQFLASSEAEIVINDGVSCFASDNPAGLGELYTHELGHTLGLGHSCGDANSPTCSSDPELARAIMRANMRRVPPGASLRNDDVLGIRFLYEGGDTGCPLAPGHPRFCTDCGPCSDGQGDCDRDSECRAGLRCIDNRGADFGFNPGIDVCLTVGGPPPPPPPGPPQPCALPAGHPRFCTDCGTCGFGEGDCDRDSDCAAGLVCTDNIGADFGFNPGIDVCVSPDGGCPVNRGTGRFCTLCGPCGSGEGDCDNDDECAGSLRCVDNVGANFGFAPGVDVCM